MSQGNTTDDEIDVTAYEEEDVEAFDLDNEEETADDDGLRIETSGDGVKSDLFPLLLELASELVISLNSAIRDDIYDVLAEAIFRNLDIDAVRFFISWVFFSGHS